MTHLIRSENNFEYHFVWLTGINQKNEFSKHSDRHLLAVKWVQLHPHPVITRGRHFDCILQPFCGWHVHCMVAHARCHVYLNIIIFENQFNNFHWISFKQQKNMRPFAFNGLTTIFLATCQRIWSPLFIIVCPAGCSHWVCINWYNTILKAQKKQGAPLTCAQKGQKGFTVSWLYKLWAKTEHF